MNLFWRSFTGRLSLAKAFWVVYLLFNIILILVISGVIYSFLYYNQTPNSAAILNFQISSRIILAIDFPYMLTSAIGVWRCAHDSPFIWRVLARIIVATNILLIFVIM